MRTLQTELEDAGVFSLTGGLAYLAALDLDLPDLQGLESYVRIVRDRARRLMSGCLETAGSCAEGSGTDAQEVLVEAERMIFRLRPRLSDLRESGAIEQAADIVLILHEEVCVELMKLPGSRGKDSGSTRSSRGSTST